MASKALKSQRDTGRSLVMSFRSVIGDADARRVRGSVLAASERTAACAFFVAFL